MKRYYTVVGPRGIAHRMFSATKVEGNLTVCGRPVYKGWRWTTADKRPHCKRCYV